MNDFDTNFVLQLLHVSDQEANTRSVDIAPQFSAVWNALDQQDIDGDGVAGYADTLYLSSGDAWIPGLFYEASAEIYGANGAADILIQNELGIQAIAFGNHEFDFGTDIIGELLSGDIDFGDDDPAGFEAFDGADFPYLSGNLDFSGDDALSGLVADDHQDATEIGGRIAQTTIVETESGERIGLVGATTPTLQTISSPGDGVVVSPDGFDSNDDADLDALAEIIQDDVDALLAAAPDLDKIILLAHMQQIAIEQELAERLEDVDIIMAGGSNTRLFDENDVGFAGDAAQGAYPTFVTGADGNPVAVVNTDFQYKYVGRLVIDFDENGVIIPDSYDPEISGAYATDEAGVARVGGEGLADPEIVAIAQAVEDEIVAGESVFYAVTTEYLNGQRQGGGTDGVRTQETNLGNLTADANLFYTRDFDEDVLVSIKNGGGIRSSIGREVVPGGDIEEPVRLPPEGVPGAKPDGGISQNDVANALSFNNGLALLSLTTEELARTLEHIVSEYTSIEVDSGMGQVGGVRFSFDPELPSGDRIVNAVVFDAATGEDVATIVEDGEVVDNGDMTFRTVTLNFLADGGSGYPFPEFEATSNRVDLVDDENPTFTGGATAAPDGSEQDALAEYLLDAFGNEDGDPVYDIVDTPVELDERIQNLDFRADTILGDDSLALGDDATVEAAEVTILGDAADAVFAPIEGGHAFRLAGDSSGNALRLIGAETVIFDDATLAASFDPDAALVARFYEVAYDRLYGFEGATFWTDDLNIVPVAPRMVASSFVAADEFDAVNGSDLDNAAFVDALIANALDGGDLAQESRDGLIADLEAGRSSRGDVLLDIARDAAVVAELENLTDDGVLLVAEGMVGGGEDGDDGSVDLGDTVTLEQSEVLVNGDLGDAVYAPIEGGHAFRAAGDTTNALTLLGAETIIFDDATLEASSDDNAALVARFYEVAYDRLYGFEGATFWTDELNIVPLTERAVANAFITADEFDAVNGADLDNAGFVDALIANALEGGSLEEESRDDLVADLDSGRSTRAEVLLDIVDDAAVTAELENITDDGVLLFA